MHVAMQLRRRPVERVDEDLRAFVAGAAIGAPQVHEGEWNLWESRPAWRGNPTHASFIVTSWQAGERRLLAAVNDGPFAGAVLGDD